jgi:hypothetical protein
MQSHSVVDVRVTLAAGGGWDVIAMLGDRILVIRHCDDWHRAERAYTRMSGSAMPYRDAAA